MARDGSLSVDIKGYAAFRRSINRLDKEIGKQVTRHVRSLTQRVRDDARRNAPKRSGKLRGSIRDSVTVKRATVYSNLAYSAVHEYGGTIKPKGTPIRIKRSRYVGRAVKDNEERIEREMTSMFDALKRDAGF